MINKRIASALATGALLLNSFAAPAFAATNIEITGNGHDSDNNANVNLTKSTSVVQNNTANVTNNVSVDSKTGDNKANDNTGGDVSITTGDSDVTVAVQNLLNKNSAVVDCCNNGNTTVKIADNGSNSDNDAKLKMNDSNQIFQDNYAYVKNKVDVDSKTGDNKANDNTNGDVAIHTGDSTVGVGVATFVNSNFARIGGGNGNGSELSLKILGNGHKSDNDINATINKTNTISQDNYADIYNKVDVDASTGKNDAKDNTGGSVDVHTGDALVSALVANAGNFNWADMSCGCLFDDLTAKIADNGSDTDNDIKLNLTSGKDDGIFQTNNADVDNKLKDLNAKTGKNDANDNTGGQGNHDPEIHTGDSGVDAQVTNQLNANKAGVGSDLEFDWNWDEIFGSLF